MKKTIKRLAATLLFNFSLNAVAGSAAGPYLIWADLARGKSSELTKKITAYVEKQEGSSLCEYNTTGWIVFFKERPNDISDNLIEEALINRKSSAKKTLIEAFSTYKEKNSGIMEGLDGVIAYSEKNGGQFVSMDTKGRVKISKYSFNHIDNENSLISSFCRASLSLYRK